MTDLAPKGAPARPRPRLGRPPASGTDFELALRVDRAATEGLSAQIVRQICDLIQTGRLPTGTPLPPTRRLATDLAVSRGVAVAAYEQLHHQGWVVARRGGGTQVAERPDRPAVESATPRRWVRELHPELTDISAFPRLAWRQAFIDAIAELPTRTLDYRSTRGISQLREQLATYLARVRRTRIDPEQLIICGGLMQALSVVRLVLGAQGIQTLAMPRITHPAIGEALALGGPRTVWLDLDEDGLMVEETIGRTAQAVVVNPTHQYPLGAALSGRRAERLLDSGSLIIEDDSNADLVHDGLAPRSLQGRLPERTVHVGSLSRALAPGIRLGWIAAPPALADALAEVVTRSSLGPSVLEQATLARFIETGELDRHLRGLRTLYRRRAQTLSDTVARELPECTLRVPASGFHAVLELGGGLDEAAVVRELARRGIRVFGLADHVLHGAPPTRALVLGYATLAEGAMPGVVGEIRSALRSVAGARGPGPNQSW